MDQYERLEEIGSGSFGKIYKVRRLADKKIFARKEIEYSRMNDKEKLQLVSEVNILRELRHPNIVRYYERSVDRINSIICIVMEYCDNGDLANLIKKHRKEKKYIDESIIWKLFSQIVIGLNECHNFKHGTILHRDLKPDNILLNSDLCVKLGDFGLSRVLEKEKDFAKTFVGTPYYMSPEQVSEATYDIKSDIWSLGCLLYELCALCPPFDASSQEQLSVKIVQGSYYKLPSIYSDDLTKLIKLMLQTNPNKRPTTLELLNYPPIKMLIQESKIAHQLRKREDEVIKREHSILRMERELEERENMILKKEQGIAIKEKGAAIKEQGLATKEKELCTKEQGLATKERMLAVKEKDLNLKERELLYKEKDLYKNSIEKKSRVPLSDLTPTSVRSHEISSSSSNSPLDRLTERMARHVSLLSAKKSNLSIVKSQ